MTHSPWSSGLRNSPRIPPGLCRSDHSCPGIQPAQRDLLTVHVPSLTLPRRLLRIRPGPLLLNPRLRSRLCGRSVGAPDNRRHPARSIPVKCRIAPVAFAVREQLALPDVSWFPVTSHTTHTQTATTLSPAETADRQCHRQQNVIPHNRVSPRSPSRQF